jgi:hypothetical protein
MRMDKTEPWGDRSPDPRPGDSLYQMKGNEEKRQEKPVSMLMVAARVG